MFEQIRSVRQEEQKELQRYKGEKKKQSKRRLKREGEKVWAGRRSRRGVFLRHKVNILNTTLGGEVNAQTLASPTIPESIMNGRTAHWLGLRTGVVSQQRPRG